jgi:hypothetical protein
MKFEKCHVDCSRSKAMWGFISHGYYPSAPIAPRFAIKEEIIIFFHFMHMSGPSSKLTYCHAIQRFVKIRTLSHIVVPDLYKSFLGVYSAWLQVQSQLQHNMEHILLMAQVTSAVRSNTTSSEILSSSNGTSMVTSMDMSTESEADRSVQSVVNMPMEDVLDSSMENGVNMPVENEVNMSMDEAGNMPEANLTNEPRESMMNNSVDKDAEVNIGPLLNEVILAWTSTNITSEWNTIPLRLRCSSCFGGTAEVGYLSFDGNFQHKRLSTRSNSQKEFGFQSADQRIFIPTLSRHLVCSV